MFGNVEGIKHIHYDTSSYSVHHKCGFCLQPSYPGVLAGSPASVVIQYALCDAHMVGKASRPATN